MPLGDVGVFGPFVRISQRQEEDLAPERLEGFSVDGSEAPKEIPSTSPGEASYLSPDTPTTMPTSITLTVPNLATLEGDRSYRASNGIRDGGIPLICWW